MNKEKRKCANIKKITKHWNKVKTETIKICVKHLDCKECPFCLVVKDGNYCHIGRLNEAIERLKGTPNFMQVELPEIIVNEERGDESEQN